MSDLIEASLSRGSADEEITQRYQGISTFAVAGVLWGVASLLAFLHPLLWVISLVGVVINVIAWRRIAKHDPPLLGRKAAWVGLFLSLVSGVCAPAQLQIVEWKFNRQAETFGKYWLTLVAKEEFLPAHQLTLPVSMRWPPDEVEANYRQYADTQGALVEFIQKPATQVLAALGDRAEVRYFRRDEIRRSGMEFGINTIFAASFHDKDELKTCLFKLSLIRIDSAERGVIPWRVDKLEFLTEPPVEFAKPSS